MASAPLPQACFVCQKTEGLKKCARCGNASYCSKEHQSKDWPKHKIICTAFVDLQPTANKPAKVKATLDPAEARKSIEKADAYFKSVGLDQNEISTLMKLLASLSAVDTFPVVEQNQWLVAKKYVDLLNRGSEQFKDDPNLYRRFNHAYYLVGSALEGGMAKTASTVRLLSQMEANVE